MQTDARLCRFLISLSPTRSSSSVTAVTNHLNHPAVRPLPALIDAGFFLLSKRSQPAELCGDTWRGVVSLWGSELAPNPWGTSVPSIPIQAPPETSTTRACLEAPPSPAPPSQAPESKQAQEMPTSERLLLNMALQISREFSLLPWQGLLAWVPTAGLCLSGKQLLSFACSLGLESQRGNPAAGRGCERLHNLCSHKSYGLLGHKQHHSTAL